MGMGRKVFELLLTQFLGYLSQMMLELRRTDAERYRRRKFESLLGDIRRGSITEPELQKTVLRKTRVTIRRNNRGNRYCALT